MRLARISDQWQKLDAITYLVKLRRGNILGTPVLGTELNILVNVGGIANVGEKQIDSPILREDDALTLAR